MTPKHNSLIRTPKHDPLSMTPQGSELSVDRPEAVLRPAPGRPLPPHSATPAPLPIGGPPRYVSTWKSTLAKWNRIKAVPWFWDPPGEEARPRRCHWVSLTPVEHGRLSSRPWTGRTKPCEPPWIEATRGIDGDRSTPLATDAIQTHARCRWNQKILLSIARMPASRRHCHCAS